MEIPQIEDCMTVEVVECRPDTDLEHAAHLMWSHDCGVLPVVDEERRVVGVLTDRDALMCAYTTGKPLRELCAADCMTTEVRTCLAGETVRSVLRTMGDSRVRRLPVVDEHGVLGGVLSVNDVVHALESTADAHTRARLLEDLLATLASIGEHRGPGARVRTPQVVEVRPAPADKARPAPSGKARTRAAAR